MSDSAYAWPLGGLDCPPNQLAEPPGWLLAMLDAVGSPAVRVEVGQTDATPIPAGRRDCELTSIAGKLRQIGLSPVEMERSLQSINSERCQPPLDSLQVIKIARSIGAKPAGQELVAVADAPPDVEPASEEVDPGATPARLLRVPGFIGELAEHIETTAPYPERSLAFAGALATQAFLAGRKVRDASGNRSSLYILSLANSGAGKEWPRQEVRKLLQGSQQEHCIGDAIASGEALEDILYANPAFLLMADEFHALFAAIKSGKESRFEGVATTLLRLFTSANHSYSMRARAVGRVSAKERAEMRVEAIDQPSLTLLASSIPSEFYNSIGPRMLTNGLFARMLILQAGKRGAGKRAIDGPIPTSIQDAANWWAALTPGAENGCANLAAIHPKPIIAPISAIAQSILDDLQADADRCYSEAESTTDIAGMAVWTRCHEKARRLAVNYACSADHLNLEITADAATWAAEFAKHQTLKMLFMAGAHVAESEFDGKQQRAMEVFRRWRQRNGDEWMPAWQLNRKLKELPPREQKEIREALIGQGLIERSPLVHDGPGRPGEAYRLR